MRVRDRIALPAAGLLGPHLFRSVYTSLRFDATGDEYLSGWRAGQPVVFVAWHGRLLPLLYLFRGHGIVMLVSQHRDGEYLARVGRGLGYDAVRGSSTRGGVAAVRRLARRVKLGRSLAITPDGPGGPKERFKPGALQIARITEAPVIPVLAGSRQAWWIEGWDSFLVPKPFANVQVAIGRPRVIPRRSTREELSLHAHSLEAELGELKAQVDGVRESPLVRDA